MTKPRCLSQAYLLCEADEQHLVVRELEGHRRDELVVHDPAARAEPAHRVDGLEDVFPADLVLRVVQVEDLDQLVDAHEASVEFALLLADAEDLHRDLVVEVAQVAPHALLRCVTRGYSRWGRCRFGCRFG